MKGLFCLMSIMMFEPLFISESIAQIMHELQQKVTTMHNLLVHFVIHGAGVEYIMQIVLFAFIIACIKKTDTLITCNCAVSLYYGISGMDIRYCLTIIMLLRALTANCNQSTLVLICLVIYCVSFYIFILIIGQICQRLISGKTCIFSRW